MTFPYTFNSHGRTVTVTNPEPHDFYFEVIDRDGNFNFIWSRKVAKLKMAVPEPLDGRVMQILLDFWVGFG